MIEQRMEGIPPTDDQAASDTDTALMVALRSWRQSLRANVSARAKILAELRAAASGR